MSLNFPNASRSYDTTRHSVRFWGYDGAFEVSFFVDEDALHKLAPAAGASEPALLKSFDDNLDRIRKAAGTAYGRRRQGSYVLTSSDF